MGGGGVWNLSDSLWRLFLWILKIISVFRGYLFFCRPFPLFYTVVTHPLLIRYSFVHDKEFEIIIIVTAPLQPQRGIDIAKSVGDLRHPTLGVYPISERNVCPCPRPCPFPYPCLRPCPGAHVFVPVPLFMPRSCLWPSQCLCLHPWGWLCLCPYPRPWLCPWCKNMKMDMDTYTEMNTDMDETFRSIQ